ncbi:MAG: 3TM-type holin [Aestuariivirgaceae bacterium]
MLWFLKLLSPLLGGIAGAPVIEIIDKLVLDAGLKQRLKTEIKMKCLDRDRQLIAASQSVLLAEQQSESWLTRSWRPLLMFLLMAFLLFFGLLLPIMELCLGHSLEIEPRLDRIPDPAWNLLTLGLGGYVGARTIEKIALGRSFPHRQDTPRTLSRKPGTLRRR